VCGSGKVQDCFAREVKMKLSRIAFTTIGIIIIFSIIVSAAFAESYLLIEERMAFVSDKIEAGGIRGALTSSEYTRLKSRFSVLMHKSARFKKSGATANQYIDLERELVGLEKDTDRLLNSLKRR
jgi:hypothetical protein